MGPTLPFSEHIHALKHRQEGESFKEAMSRIAGATKDSEEHFLAFRDALYNQRFIPAGRVQAAVGAARLVTPFNCFVSRTIPDSLDGIMMAALEAAQTMKLGGGIGYDFSTIRPRGDNITTIDSQASGPVSYMHIFDAVCKTVASAGHRRGAQMAVLRVDHPDIEEFVRCKRNEGALTAFNISVAVTEQFMRAVKDGGNFPLQFQGKIYKYVSARSLWNEIMRSTWDWAEPGVLFIDTINDDNNLFYCEGIRATNPCAEQPLPPFGACLLGSFNLAKYMYKLHDTWVFRWTQFRDDIPHVVRAMDNVIDRAVYPLPDHRIEAQTKRRMGLGITGTANAIEAMGYKYGSYEYIDIQNRIMSTLRDCAYGASIQLAKEKGTFDLFSEEYLESNFIRRLPRNLQDGIKEHGIRNSHLISIAPTGTISMTADNVSSGIEPVFALSQKRKVNLPEGTIETELEDYGYRVFGVKGRTSEQCTTKHHVDVLISASYFCDSSVSKTCNVGDDVTWEEFKNIYTRVYEAGGKGCTTFRAAGNRGAMMVSKEDPGDNLACVYDPETGMKTCE